MMTRDDAIARGLIPISDDGHHPAMFKTLDLLEGKDINGGPLYFILEGMADVRDDPIDKKFFYESHSCPTNWLPVEALFTPDDDDPHGALSWVRSVWMPANYGDLVDAVDPCDQTELLRALFPEARRGAPPAMTFDEWLEKKPEDERGTLCLVDAWNAARGTLG